MYARARAHVCVCVTVCVRVCSRHGTHHSALLTQFFLSEDRLCFSLGGQSATSTHDFGDGTLDSLAGGAVRYIALDRISLRPLPHR